MKILMVLPRVPYPLTKGDKLRAYHHIKELSTKHDIILCALTDEKLHPEAISELKKYCISIHIFRLPPLGIFFSIVKAFFTGLPLQVGYFYNKNIEKKILKVIETSKPDHIFCQLIRVSAYAQKVHNIPKTLDYQDVFSKGVYRRQKKAALLFKPVLHLEYKRLLKYEHNVFDEFTHKIIISETDRALIPHPENKKIHVVPNGVDTDFFSPKETEKIYDLVFTGNMAYPPNINAVEYICKQILPLLIKSKPDIRILIAGTSPAKRIRKLQSKNVIVSGWINDIRNCYAQSRIFLAPMQIGTGLQNKLLEAMAMQLPCISSDLANKALNAQDGKEIIIGHTPQAYVDHILNLLKDDKARNTLANNGHKFVKENFKWGSLTDKINTIMETSP